MEANRTKRKPSQELEEQADPVAKKPRISRQLLDLSDDVLLQILENLPVTDLISLSETCSRLGRIAYDESLWKSVSTVESPLSPARCRKLVKFLNSKTTSICLGGFKNPPQESVTSALLTRISDKCPSLEHLALEGCHLDAER